MKPIDVGVMRAVYTRLIRVFRKILPARFFETRFFRKVFFNCADPGSLLISNGLNETFVIAASDKVIGKEVFIGREPYDFEKIETALKLLGDHKRTLMIDVGANIGTICIPAVKRGLFQRAVAIEPEPLNYSLLVANISINQLGDKIITHNIALGEKDDQSLIFELSEDNYGDHRIRVGSDSGLFNEDGRKIIRVKSETLNKIMGEGDASANATLIWMDTQGFEGYVLSGASKALEQKTPICLEFWPYGMARSKCYSRLKDALTSNGYRFFYNLDNKAYATPLTSQSLDSLYNELGEGGSFSDLLVV